MTLRWEGIDALTRRLATTAKEAETLVAGAMLEEGEAMMATAKRDTPVDTGTLRASGHVETPQVGFGQVTVTLAYGTDYAVYVHEIRDNQHPVGKAKFLEDAVKAAARRFGARIQDRLARRL
jgi:hypothetical protein